MGSVAVHVRLLDALDRVLLLVSEGGGSSRALGLLCRRHTHGAHEGADHQRHRASPIRVLIVRPQPFSRKTRTKPNERERLGERDTEEHRGAHHARRLGLASHGGDGVADDEADADARADGGAAVDDAGADDLEAFVDVGRLLCKHGKHWILLVSCPGCFSARDAWSRRCTRR